MRKNRNIFYKLLLFLFPVFLLHWNGLFSQTYWWALEAVDGTKSFLPQVTFSFISALIIFGTLIILYELIFRIEV